MVSSPHHHASRIGLDVLESGGNAIDAAIATSAAVMVTCPMQCGPGGDAIWLIREASGTIYMLDATGRAPQAASAPGLRLDGHRHIDKRSGASVTVPGAVSGWEAAHAKLGTMPFADLLEPAAALADAGFAVSRHLRASFMTAEPALRDRNAIALWAPDGSLPQLYACVKQPRLACTLRDIGQTHGRSFYDGPLAAAIVAACRQADGWLSEADLVEHRADWIAPLCAQFRDVEVFTCGPSSQGFVLLAALRIFEALAPERIDPLAPQATHLMIEALAVALRERDRILADRSKCTTEVGKLLQEGTIAALAGEVRPDRASRREAPAIKLTTKGDTANLVVVDASGLAVSLTQSLFFDFGSGIPVPEGGFTLHNRGAAFTLVPGAPAELAPGLRPPHTLMTTLVTRGGQLAFALGCMGGDGQPQTQMQLLLDMIDGGLDPQQAVSRPRWYLERSELPASPVIAETGIAPAVLCGLEQRHHQVIVLGASEEIMGHAQVIAMGPDGVMIGASDPRSDGQVAAF